jgi:hypothetical protein
MCKLILRDEARHIDFHRDRLIAQMPQGPSLPWSLKFMFLEEACAWFLWIGKNGHCLRVLGSTRAEFFHHVRSGLANLSRKSAVPCQHYRMEAPKRATALSLCRDTPGSERRPPGETLHACIPPRAILAV